MEAARFSQARRGVLAYLADNLSIGVAARAAGGAGQWLLALVMVGLGIRGLATGDFAGTWQRIPIAHLPAREPIAYLCAVVELATGLGLLTRRAARVSSAVLSVYLLLWVVLLKSPAVIVMPRMEATWLGMAEIATILAGAWVVFAALSPRQDGRFLTGGRGVRHARALFVLSLLPIGLAHFFYATETASFVPDWLPWHYAWAYLTGAGSIAAAAAIACGVWPRLAATLEAAMLGVITLLVWLPGVFSEPGNDSWTGFLISSAIACGAWAVADSYHGVPWFAMGRRRR
jgi:uncharacterized membrane protein YphA (DoxX/SURF4 family)